MYTYIYKTCLSSKVGKTQFTIRPDRPDFSFEVRNTGKYRYIIYI